MNSVKFDCSVNVLLFYFRVNVEIAEIIPWVYKYIYCFGKIVSYLTGKNILILSQFHCSPFFIENVFHENFMKQVYESLILGVWPMGIT